VTRPTAGRVAVATVSDQFSLLGTGSITTGFGGAATIKAADTAMIATGMRNNKTMKGQRNFVVFSFGSSNSGVVSAADDSGDVTVDATGTIVGISGVGADVWVFVEWVCFMKNSFTIIQPTSNHSQLSGLCMVLGALVGVVLLMALNFLAVLGFVTSNTVLFLNATATLRGSVS
jgi:hypothetical protein